MFLFPFFFFQHIALDMQGTWNDFRFSFLHRIIMGTHKIPPCRMQGSIKKISSWTNTKKYMYSRYPAYLELTLKLPCVGIGSGGSPRCWNADAGVSDANEAKVTDDKAVTVELMLAGVWVPPDEVVDAVEGWTVFPDTETVPEIGGADATDWETDEACCWLGLTSLPKMLLSDIWSLWLTGGTLARVAGSLLTSCFMSLSNSSSWFSTENNSKPKMLFNGFHHTNFISRITISVNIFTLFMAIFTVSPSKHFITQNIMFVLPLYVLRRPVFNFEAHCLYILLQVLFIQCKQSSLWWDATF